MRDDQELGADPNTPRATPEQRRRKLDAQDRAAIRPRLVERASSTAATIAKIDAAIAKTICSPLGVRVDPAAATLLAEALNALQRYNAKTGFVRGGEELDFDHCLETAARERGLNSTALLALPERIKVRLRALVA